MLAGKIIARQFLLPFLLGFKFNVATLIPIIFGALAIMAKKFFFICKLGLILSSAIGLASILFAVKPQHLTTQNQGYGGHYGHYGYNRYSFSILHTIKDPQESLWSVGSSRTMSIFGNCHIYTPAFRF